MYELTESQNGIPEAAGDLTRFALVGREKLAAIRAEIRAIDKLKLADGVRAQKIKEGQDIAEAVIDAEVRIGELLKSVPKAQGKRTDIEHRDTDVPKFDTPKQQARETLNISRKQADRYVILAENKDIIEQAKQEARENDDIISRSFALEKIKTADRERKEADRAAVIQEQRTRAVAEPSGLYSCIVIDPPWNYGTQYDAAGRRSANPYPEITQDELKDLDIRAADDCIMFLWTTHRFIQSAFELLDVWGFEYRSMIVWDKEKIGLGDFLRMQCEFCLVGIKGKPSLNNPRNIRDIIREPRREHSRKPEAFYRLVEELCPGAKIEYFARTPRDAWTVYGNDTERF